MSNTSSAPRERLNSTTSEFDGTAREPNLNIPIPPFVCISASLRRLIMQARTAAAHSQIASIEGEPGVGKHLFAQTLHYQSTLAPLPFRRFDAREWLASETDISALRGTLYLDRIDLLASTGQGLLLNLIKSLQDSPPARFLLLSSTHIALRKLANDGRFLPDLAFRIAAVRLWLPPLRDRREDIAPIAQALLERICSRYHQPAAVLAAGTLPRLLQHSWPGNVRELASTLESAILESRTGVLRPGDIVLDAATKPPATWPESEAEGVASSAISSEIKEPDSLTLNAAILRHIRYVLERNRGNKLRAARQLEISRSTLYRILAGGSLASTDPDSPND